MTNILKTPLSAFPLAIAISLAGCGDDNIDPNGINVPDVYEFESLSDPSAGSSVDYKQAITHTVLIQELAHLLASDRLQNVQTNNEAEELIQSYYEIGTKASAGANLSLIGNDLYSEGFSNTAIHFNGTSGLEAKQQDFSYLSPNTNLKDQMAGITEDLILRQEEDETGENGEFLGWNTTLGLARVDGDIIPNQIMIDALPKLKVLANDGDINTKYITPTNIDYRAFFSAFLLGSIHYSVVNSKLLNPDKGLLSDNTAQVGLPYTQLEHNWDLAFGYFGASRDANTRSDTYNLEYPDNDSNLDHMIDLESELNSGFALMAMELDSQAPLSEINFSGSIIQKFLLGRQIILEHHGINPSDDPKLHNKLSAIANDITESWELLLAARVIYQTNQTIGHLLQGHLDLVKLEDDTLDSIDSDEYLESWSKLKGLILALQYTANNKLDKETLKLLNVNVGSSPKIKTSERQKHSNELSTIKVLINNVYNFSKQNTDAWGFVEIEITQ